MQISDQGKKFLQEAGKWATFISITGFIGIALLIIMSFSIGTILANMPEGTLGGISPRFLSFFYLILGGVYFVPVFFLFQFGTSVKKAFEQEDLGTMTFAFKKLRAHYKFIGVLIIISIVFYILSFFLGLFAAVMA